MRILYFSDNYTFDNMGTKRSIYLEAIAQGNDCIWIDKIKIPDILSLIKQHCPDQVWLAHSNLRLPAEVKKKISVPVVGFGFSDPYYFSPDRFLGYDVYVTNYRKIFEKYQDAFPIIYNATACDFRFHAYNSGVEKKYDISILGLAKHPRFNNSIERVEFVNKLRKFLGGFQIEAFGRGWDVSHPNNHLAVSGEKFRSVIQSSRIGLDIQDDWSPLAHRMFEYAACGVPVCTRRRPEVLDYFEEDVEILCYDTYDELSDKVTYYLYFPDLLEKMGIAAWERCKKEHNINFRVSHIILELERLL